MLKKKYLKNYPIYLIIICNIFLYGCKEITGPSQQPGRRDYRWTQDTISIPFSTIRHMWGVNPNNIWAIATPGDYDSVLFHYDGNTWKKIKTPSRIDPVSIFGFSENDIWIGCGGGELLHYNGSIWAIFTTLSYSNHRIDWSSICGITSNDIYAVGAYEDEELYLNNGVIAHFNGTKWEILDQFNRKGIYSSIIFSYSDKNYYLTSSRWNSLGDSSLVYQFNGKDLNQIYIGDYTHNEFATINSIYPDVIFSLGLKLFTYNGNKFSEFLNINDNDYYYAVVGRTRSDFFIYMENGVQHYNGSNMQYIYTNTNLWLHESLVFNNFIFFSGQDKTTGKTIIVKGELL